MKVKIDTSIDFEDNIELQNIICYCMSLLNRSLCADGWGTIEQIKNIKFVDFCGLEFYDKESEQKVEEMLNKCFKYLEEMEDVK